MEAFRHNAKLRYLYLDNNALTRLPADIFNHNLELRYLYLDNNPFTSIPLKKCWNCIFWLDRTAGANGTLSRTGWCNATCTGSLYLDNKGIVSIANGTFDGMPDLHSIYLSSNALTSIPADAFRHNTELRYLYLNSNALTSIPVQAFQHNTELRTLDLSNNALTSIPKDTFKYNTKLYSLNVDNNPLTGIPILLCGGCIFWLDGTPNVNATLSKAGWCNDTYDCIGSVSYTHLTLPTICSV